MYFSSGHSWKALWEAGCCNVTDRWTDVDCWEVHVCMSGCEWEFCACLKYNAVKWEQFIWLKMIRVQGVSFFSRKRARIFMGGFSFFFSEQCLSTDRASDDAGMMECYGDAEESKLSQNDTLNVAYTLYFSQTDTAECKYHCHASPSIKKEFGFLLSNHSSAYLLSHLPRPLR